MFWFKPCWNKQKWKPPSSLFKDLDPGLSPSCNDEVIVDVPRIQTLHGFIELTPQTISTAGCPRFNDASQRIQRETPRYMIRMCRDSGAPNHSGFLYAWVKGFVCFRNGCLFVSSLWLLVSNPLVFFQTIEWSTCYVHLFPLEVFLMFVIQSLNIWMTKNTQPHPPWWLEHFWVHRCRTWAGQR